MIETLSEHACFGGVQGFYRHESAQIGAPMRFGIYRPPQAADGPVPVLLYLAGLTCTEETFAIKAGAQAHAARHGLMLVTPDTSPRGTGFEGATTDWDFGEGAGFYIDATEAPWAARFRMESWLIQELLPQVLQHFGGAPGRVGIFGHSMGGHGALTLALKHPGLFRSVSAFAPICAPSRVPWGEKAFGRYLGPDRRQWLKHDAAALIEAGGRTVPVLVDQGLSDKFLAEQLSTDALEQVCVRAGQPLTLRRHAGYDHGYYFIASFIADHLVHHAEALVG
ncbi:S-formylglutathione hydrolase [Ideonella sp. YS5]|uniref:S-formylglutathione hydrolase n=1 Tax=Ideonella sp. YS5 TaxID=3453714 RepID=UPI003EEE898E